MRKILALLLMLSVVFTAGCASEYKQYTVNLEGEAYTVDRETRCVIHDGVYYKYEITPDTKIITYPNGYEYTISSAGGHATGAAGTSDEGFVPGRTLSHVLSQETYIAEEEGRSPFLAYLLAMLGFFCVAAPKTAWLLMNGWIYGKTEPGKGILLATRICGVVAIIIVAAVMI